MSVPWFDWMTAQLRRSGKSVSGTMSTTPQIESMYRRVGQEGVCMACGVRSFGDFTCLIAIHGNVERLAHPRMRT